jgi:thiol-disulfide isomerase/thioredoxin
MFYEDFGTEFLLTLDGQEFRTFTSGSATKNSRLPIDRDENGQISRNFESTTVGKPFNFTGTTYVFTFENNRIDLKVAEEELPMAPMPPDLRIGKPALEFAATTLDGDSIEFPSKYAGKIVMLDFWATWCGPCIAEIPNMKEAYSEWHDKGFEILGVSFDAEDKETEVTEFLEEYELTWAQIYEGKGWDTTLGNMHDVSGIPFVLLVDGDSGEILATSKELRGKGLSKFIGEQLKDKTGE